MKITVRIDRNYGILTCYPVCDAAKIFARLAGTKTLTSHALRDIAALGYQIEQAAPNIKDIANLSH